MRNLLRCNRRRRLVVVLALACVGFACGREPEAQHEAVVSGNEGAALRYDLPVEIDVEGDSWPDYPDAGRRRFDSEFSMLRRLGSEWGTVYSSRSRAGVVDRLRSELAPSDPLYEITESGLDDRVLLRVPATGAPDSAYFLVHTEGMSGDPGFYTVRARDGARSTIIWGEVIALSDSGPAMLYQRTNSLFGRRRTVEIRDGMLLPVSQDLEPVALRSIVLGPMSLRRGPSDSTVVASLVRGDSVFVLEAARVEERGGPIFHVRTSAGIQGWVRVAGGQCPSALIRSICFYGD